LQEGRSSTFAWLQETENAGRLNKEIENMKRGENPGTADQTSRSDNHQIYELAAEVILRKLIRVWQKSFFDELTTNANHDECSFTFWLVYQVLASVEKKIVGNLGEKPLSWDRIQLQCTICCKKHKRSRFMF
jgi:hypothetical protein